MNKEIKQRKERIEIDWTFIRYQIIYKRKKTKQKEEYKYQIELEQMRSNFTITLLISFAIISIGYSQNVENNSTEICAKN